MILDIVSGTLIIAGSLLALIAGIGLVRLPDVFARMHAATKPATLGLVLVAFGAMFQVDSVPGVTKLAIVIALQFLTSPVGAHLVGRAAYHAGTELSPDTVLDELASAPE